MKPFSAIILAILPAISSAALVTNFNAGVFDVTTNAGDSVTLTIAGGNLKINGADPTGGPRPIADIGLLRVNGDNLANVFNLSGITPATTGLSMLVVEITGFGGSDTLTGSGFSDKIVGGAGADTMNGLDGDDRFELTYGNGNDIFIGGPGNDVITIFGTGSADDMTFTSDSGIPVLLNDQNIVYRVEFDSIEEISLFAGAGNDNVVVEDMLVNGPQIFRYDGQTGGSNNLNTTNFKGSVEVTRNPTDSGDTVRFSPTSPNNKITINSLINTATDYQISGDFNETSFTILDNVNFLGQIQIFNADDLIMNGSNQNDDFRISADSNLLDRKLETFTVNALGGNDEIRAGASDEYKLTVNGGNGTDTLIYDARNASATITATQIIVPFTIPADYTSIENLSVINDTPGPRNLFFIY